ncbi:L-arabinokinase-like isoform X2 [Cucumis melo]|uniref:L-arabinokinase-like isoform X2 n=1 Tax=Cucumis melo TaxID=3656 RepID=A0A1S4E5S5_CUCME|nr:L-arabinokinase-like isoform X2 [Cucumis melo]
MGIQPETSSENRLVFAYYITGHGFGHATRVIEVVRHLILAGHEVHVVSAAPEFVFTSAIQSPRLFIRKVLLDCGAVQTDALTVDRLASLEKYHETAVVHRHTILETEAEWLKSIKADLVLLAVLLLMLGFALFVLPTSEYIMDAGHHHRSIVWQIAEDYSHCQFLIRLPGYCPMPAFRDVVDAPLVVRRLHKTRQEVRSELGIGDDVKLVILNFGGQPADWKLKDEYLPSGWLCLVCGASDTEEVPPNFIKLAKDAYTPDLIAASDCMLGKIGYGTVSEALAYKVPFVFVRRDYFNEEPFLRSMLEYYQSGVEMIRRDLLTGQWKPYLERAISLKPCYVGGVNGGEITAHILQETAAGKNCTSDKFSGARRLQDAIILGYQLQRVRGRDLLIPEWYANAENEFALSIGSPTCQVDERSSPIDYSIEDFEVLHGDVQGFPDSVNFLKSLVELDSLNDNGSTEVRREQKAAAGLFNWQEDIFVTRAPGRLDVMGGIADYSGSLVLQMPIREACHVALQKNHPSKHRLWKHVQARQDSSVQGQTPVLQIVSYGSEFSNRAPTFDMNLSDFMDGGKPISYENARKYFSKDPAQKWAAYVAGTILVLMRELGVRFEDSISMLVSSAVPEGKGVSSSASVEVASLSAIAAAHGLSISSRDIALLCQKVENCIVGAPCGVMDQMTSACGEANKLLAMVCQPAEVLGLVEIPSHIRFWGLDSGIRHSVGGADYGSVRIGAFMGREIIKSTASSMLPVSSSVINGVSNYDSEDNSVELLQTESSLDYLCNLPPHRYEAIYAKLLPESITGEAFVEKFVNHNDPVTVIDEKRSYAVRASARHPIYENFRVKAFKALLTSATSDEQLTSLGELLYQCHYSYSECGLGADGTDRLVELVQKAQHSKSEDGTLYGAKITGGGCGGTVCAIGKNSLRTTQQIIEIQQRYKDATGYSPFIFEGSSPGAGKFGHLRIRRRSSGSPKIK